MQLRPEPDKADSHETAQLLVLLRQDRRPRHRHPPSLERPRRYLEFFAPLWHAHLGCNVHYTLYDHFGLDWADIRKHGDDHIPLPSTGNGFKAWYILQHYRSAKPFITKIDITERLIAR